MTVPILMYHSIDDDNYELSVNKKNFYNQMKLLSFFGYSTISFDELSSPKNLHKKIIITFDDGYKNNLTNALPVLKKFNFQSTCYLVASCIGSFNSWDKNKDFFQKKELMNEDDVKNWLDNGQFIGSHTLNHYNLQDLDTNLQSKEIKDSKKKIEDTFKVKVNSFSYPYGRYDKSSIEIVKNNYKFCVTTSRSRFDSNKHSSLLLPRVHINKNTSLFKFFLKIFTIYEDLNYKNLCRGYK